MKFEQAASFPSLWGPGSFSTALQRLEAKAFVGETSTQTGEHEFSVRVEDLDG
jgi:hypothetical protein